LDMIRTQTGGCATGSAVATSAGKLPARYVFHAVGPVYRGGRHGEPELLVSCYRKCLELAEERDVETISFPAISTGVYGYPIGEAAAIALHEVARHLERPGSKVQHAIFVLFGRNAYDAYVTALASFSLPSGP
jgi:O-acetyl-ADP-ribose deacetylase